MRSLKDQLGSYGAYHRAWRNKLCHFVGVPLVTFSLLLLLSWFRFIHAPDFPLTAGTVFYLSVFLYYLCLDWEVALLQAPFTLALLGLADRAALLPVGESLLVFAAAFLGGWAVQLLGHAFEGGRPALTDNLWQVFNAPLFLTVEVLTSLGFRRDLGGPPPLAASGTGANKGVREPVGPDAPAPPAAAALLGPARPGGSGSGGAG
jgi:uncharacterized membrane protein YGL010W